MMMNFSKFSGLDVMIDRIEWDSDDGTLPKTEEYSIGFDTLVDDGILVQWGIDYAMDENSYTKYLKTMLENDYGTKVKSIVWENEIRQCDI